MKNPFVIYGYESSATFCDRVEETRKLTEAIENGRNVTLLAERRIGKTGLIKHLFSKLKSRGAFTTVYVDIFAVQNLESFVRAFAAAVVGSMDTKLEKAIVAATQFFKSFRPGVEVDPVTGAPSISFSLQASQLESTLKECFAYLEKKGKCVIAIDEFQQIAEFPEKGVEGLLRSYIQFLPDTRFIFAGSRHHLMTEMFASAKRPFYNSTQTLPLDRIRREVYCEFALHHMAAGGVKMEEETFNRVYDLFDGVTWYVQLVMNRMFARGSARPTDLSEVVEELLVEKNWEYAGLLKSLPAGSARLLRALAREGCVASPTAADFLTSHRLGASSSVHLALGKLKEDELVYDGESGFVVYDRLFGLWLSRLPK